MDKTQTFAEIGIPFPLYEAPIETCSDFRGQGDCSICKRAEQWIFSASIGDDLIVACGNCEQLNALSCYDKKDETCTSCSKLVPWPLSQDEVLVCYDCLRVGRAALNQDTDLGMIRWEDTQRGNTHGIPGPNLSGFAAQPKEDDPEWQEYQIAREDMEELNRTPGYSSWQGERWPFHCGRVMVYIGEPKTRPQSEATPEVVAATMNLVKSEGWNLNESDIWNSSICVYLFRCAICGALGGHSDCD